MATAKEISEFHDRILGETILGPFLEKTRRSKADAGNWTEFYSFIGGDAIPHALDLDLSTIRAMNLHPWWERFLLEDLLSSGENSPTHLSIQRFWERQHRALTREEVKATGSAVRATGTVLKNLQRRADHPDILQDFYYSAALLVKDWEQNVPGMLKKWSMESHLRGDVGNTVIFDYSDRGRSPQGVGEVIHARRVKIYRSDTGMRFMFEQALMPHLKSYFDSNALDPSYYNFTLMDRNSEFTALGPWREVILSLLTPEYIGENLEFITEAKVHAFLDLSQEYNVEWAKSAFDWADGGTPSVPSTFGRIVAESPWSSTTLASPGSQ